ncbi:MAG: hypothetical protein QJ16_C0018G0008 [archaeon GW2011_AR1]|nr:MAG: hypothetical protein QJ16_C0018G0008 [archaeon GW2011_AR1]
MKDKKEIPKILEYKDENLNSKNFFQENEKGSFGIFHKQKFLIHEGFYDKDTLIIFAPSQIEFDIKKYGSKFACKNHRFLKFLDEENKTSLGKFEYYSGGKYGDYYFRNNKIELLPFGYYKEESKLVLDLLKSELKVL